MFDIEAFGNGKKEVINPYPIWDRNVAEHDLKCVNYAIEEGLCSAWIEGARIIEHKEVKE